MTMGAARAVFAAAVAAAALAGTVPAAAAGTTAPAAHAAAAAPAAGSGLPASYQAFLRSAGGSRFVAVDGVRMHYVAAGAVSRPVLLLLHGSPDNIYTWRNIMPELARTYRVIAPDLIGFGLSGKPAGQLTWAEEIQYLTGFIDAEHLHHLTMVATDIGGLFGFAYASSHPTNVAGIALWETVTAPIPSYALLGSYCPACVTFFTTPKNPVLAEKDIIGNPGFAAEVYGGAGLLHPLTGDALAGYGYFLSTRAERRNVVDIGAGQPIGGRPAGNYAIAAAFARYLRTSSIPKLVLYASPGAILPGATAIGLGFPDTSYVSVGKGYHYLAEDEAAAITRAILRWRAHLPGFAGGPGA